VSVSVAQCRPTPKARTRGEDGGRRMTNSALDASLDVVAVVTVARAVYTSIYIYRYGDEEGDEGRQSRDGDDDDDDGGATDFDGLTHGLRYRWRRCPMCGNHG